MLALEIICWAATALIIYTYAGYPAVLALGTRWRIHPKLKSGTASAILPSVTLFIPACNEERWIARKIENTLALCYPKDRIEIVVASDGSTDRTAQIAHDYELEGVRVAVFPDRIGKQEMLNRLVPLSTSDIVVMTDAHAMLAEDSLTQLMRPFADPKVACVIGRRVCVLQQRCGQGVAESFYWRYESWIKNAESQWHSCLAATGQLYAVARKVFPHVERVGEDFYIPMKILASTGLRIAYAPAAIAAIPVAASLSAEFERKTRAHVAFLIALPMLKDLLVPGRTPVWWQFISHHVLRMVVPPAMLTLFLASAAASSNRIYLGVTAAQIFFYVLAFIGWRCAAIGWRPKLLYFPFYFVFVQLALAQSWWRWPRGKFDYAWQRTERLTDAN